MLSLDNLVDVFSKTKHTKMFDLVVFVSLQNLHLAVYNEASLLSTKRGIGRVLCQHLLSSQKNVGAHTGRGGASHMARYGACHTLIFLELIPQNHTSCHERFKELKNC
jgi:hypothetical protein